MQTKINVLKPYLSKLLLPGEKLPLDHTKEVKKKWVNLMLFPKHFSHMHFFFFLDRNTNYITLCLLNISVKSGTLIQNDCSIPKMGLPTGLLWSVTPFHYE